MGLPQTVVAVALFFLASLNSFTGSGWLAVSQLAGVVFKFAPGALVQLHQCGSAARVLIQAANKAHHSRPAAAGTSNAVAFFRPCALRYAKVNAMNRRYLDNSEVESVLRRGKSVESFLGGLSVHGEIGIRWISVGIESGSYVLRVYESADIGDEDFLDVYEFGPLNCDLEFEDPVFQTKFVSLDKCSEHLIAQYSVTNLKFVNQGIIQDEYLDYVVAGRPIA
ncbi:MAG: hypothetical protein KKE94_03565 [Gammaproteobacteria bacterium]|nr:hypothetical protein [Gammaproteobacteria bacterium]